MSWSISAVGKPSAVAERVADQLAKQKCIEPEETVKSNVAAAIATALGAFPEGMAVKVEASGSQNGPNGGPAANTLSVRVETLYGFVE